MKRAPELRDLSADHHQGLSLARLAKETAAGKRDRDAGEVWSEVAGRFGAELEPHFRIEETVLAPALAAHGEHALVRRLLHEHAALRAFIDPGAPRTAAALGAFGELLEAHIRFEERELFETAQQVLDAAELRAVAEATHRA